MGVDSYAIHAFLYFCITTEEELGLDALITATKTWKPHSVFLGL